MTCKRHRALVAEGAISSKTGAFGKCAGLHGIGPIIDPALAATFALRSVLAISSPGKFHDNQVAQGKLLRLGPAWTRITNDWIARPRHTTAKAPEPPQQRQTAGVTSMGLLEFSAKLTIQL